ncbi:hypothetical protein BGX31_005862, partial [Mortierella sp. GBA43]
MNANTYYNNNDFSYSEDDDDDVDMAYSNDAHIGHVGTGNPNIAMHNSMGVHGHGYSSSFGNYTNSLESNFGNHSPYGQINSSSYGSVVGQNNYPVNNSLNVHANPCANMNANPASVAQTDRPAEKIRKKPGRKPGPTCPALRKEQNRAAQRAFRDRKERHLHQLENMIKDLKSQHFLVISAYQREVSQLKGTIESLQSENYYLREVVFAFESALSKGNHVTILKDVKQELFRRHYENKAAVKPG